MSDKMHLKFLFVAMNLRCGPKVEAWNLE